MLIFVVLLSDQNDGLVVARKIFRDSSHALQKLDESFRSSGVVNENQPFGIFVFPMK